MSIDQNMLITQYDKLSKWYDLMYAAMGTKPGPYSPQLAAHLLTLCKEKGIQNILDCACGTGDPIIGIAKEGRNLRCIGTDGSALMLNRCVWNALTSGLSVLPLSDNEAKAECPGVISIAKASWLGLEELFPASSFDLLMCRGHAIYHLCTRESTVRFIKSMTSLIRSGGYVLTDTLSWANDLRGEMGRDVMKFRGIVPPDAPGNDTGKQLLMMDFCEYWEDMEAVSGVIQRKTLHVFSFDDGNLSILDSVSVIGAPYNHATLADMMSESGLSHVEVINLEGVRYPAVIGRKS
ncbi:MAG: class I SAM-dependent methyltransferase [Dehalococcoidia bacterium]|nr:class I SAM-dependent methyltransferase [Dehalococcoidia bacterium]